MEKRLLFNRIALHAGHVSKRDLQHAPAVEANLADTRLSFLNPAAVPANKAMHPVLLELLKKVAGLRVLYDYFNC